MRGHWSITPLGKVVFTHTPLETEKPTAETSQTTGKQLQLEFAVSHQTQICGESGFIDVVFTKILLL